MDKIPPITYLGRITEADKDTLKKLRGSEAFKLCLKLISEEHAITAQMISECPTEHFGKIQGKMIAIQRLWNTMCFYANASIPEEEIKKRNGKLRNFVDLNSSES